MVQFIKKAHYLSQWWKAPACPLRWNCYGQYGLKQQRCAGNFGGMDTRFQSKYRHIQRTLQQPLKQMGLQTL